MARQSDGRSPSDQATASPEGTSSDRGIAVDGRDPDLTSMGTAAGMSTGPRPASESRTPGQVIVKLVGRDLTDIRTPVAAFGCFNDHVLSGQNLLIDQRLGGLVRVALDQGMVGSELGQTTILPLGRLTKALSVANESKPKGGGVRAENLMCVSLGETSQFALNDYRFVFMKVLMAVKVLGIDEFAVALVNASRVSYRPERTLQAIFDGFADAFDRHGLVQGTSSLSSWSSPFRLVLAEPDFERFRRLEEALTHFASTWSQGLQIQMEKSIAPLSRRRADPTAWDEADASDDGPVLRFSISVEQRGAGGREVTVRIPFEELDGPVPEDPVVHPRTRRQVFRCSATTESAVIPVRLQEVDEYLVSRLRERMIGSVKLAEQERYGQLMSAYLLPEDFIKLIEGQTPLTLALDSTTAVYPWEMAALEIDRQICFLGPDIGLTRQFSMLSAQPGVVPPINGRLDVLLIADPAPDREGLALPKARAEGFALAQTLAKARRAWGRRLDVRLTIRIGSVDDAGTSDDALRAQLREAFDEFLSDGDSSKVDLRETLSAEIEQATRCDPLEILSLLLTQEFDVVHFAGHGVFDPIHDRKGWVFNRDCVLSAREIFRVRQVPRLVFANACRSSQVELSDNPLPEPSIQNAGLAEAFFARGIENYLGAGWQVGDEAARDFAVQFYSLALGLGPDGRPLPQGPLTLLEAQQGARKKLLDQIRRAGQPNAGASALSTWGAYQHYGKGTSKLVLIGRS